MLRSLGSTAVVLGALAASAHAGVGNVLAPRRPRPDRASMLAPVAPRPAEFLPAMPFDEPWTGRPVPEWTFVPPDQLYPARLAQVRYPRVSVRIIGSPTGHRPQLETGLGGYWAFVRWHPDGTDDWGFEWGGYSGIVMRFDLENDTDLLGTDGIWGFPLSWRYRNFALLLSVGHISGHLGDETIFHAGRDRINYLKEELTFGFAWEPWRLLRLYGEFAGAMRLGGDHGPRKTRPFRGRWGVELVPHEVWPNRWPIYLAIDWSTRQEVGWNVTTHIEAGYILWQDGLRNTWRLAISWMHGREVLTQFHDKRTKWWTISLLGDV